MFEKWNYQEKINNQLKIVNFQQVKRIGEQVHNIIRLLVDEKIQEWCY